MSLTYTWKLSGLKKANSESVNDVVIGTRWELTGTDEDGNSGSFSGATPFNLHQAQPENFVPYDQLTEEIVLGWIQAEVTGGYKDHIDGKIMEQIAKIKSQQSDVSDGGFPWSPAPEPVVAEEAPLDPPIENVVDQPQA